MPPRTPLAKYIPDRRLAAVVAAVLSLAIVAALAGYISDKDPIRTGYAKGLTPPSPSFPFGTDQLGRDIFTWVLHGLRVSLIVGISSALIAMSIALVLGMLSGYFGGWIDNLVMRVADVFLSIPRFILILFAVILFSPTLLNIVLVIGLFSWPEPARIVRSEVLSAKSREYVLAARSMGASDLDIMFSEIAPNIAPTALAVGALLVSDSILIEAALSFLGLGDPDLPSLGRMLSIARQAIFAGGWWALLFPSIFIIVLIVLFNLLSDLINEVYNPRLR